MLSKCRAWLRLLSGAFILGWLNVPCSALAQVWFRSGSDESRWLNVTTLSGDAERDFVRFISTNRNNFRFHVEVRCGNGTRAESIADDNQRFARTEPIRSDLFVPFDRFEAGAQEESALVCRWLRGDPEAVRQIIGAGGNSPPHRPLVAAPRDHAPRAEARRVSLGSGFIVATRLAVTNEHVVSGCKSIAVRQDDETRAAELLGAHAPTDLALLSLSAPLGTPANIRSVASLGEDVMVAGHPLSGLLTSDIVVTSGQVNSLGGLRSDPTLFQLSAGVHSGNSGGPVLDKSGGVVGVVVAKLDALKLGRATGEIPQNINFAIKPEVLRLFLDTHRVRYGAASPNSRKLDGAELATRARGITVQVVCQG